MSSSNRSITRHSRIAIALSVVATFLPFLLLTPPARAQCTPRWLDRQPIPGLDAPPNVAVEWDTDGPGPQPSKLFVGGFYNYAGLDPAASLATFDGSQWQAVSPPLFSTVVRNNLPIITAMIVFQNRLIVGGWFDRAGTPGAHTFPPAPGIPVNSVAMFDGQRWMPMGNGLNGRPNQFIIFNNQLYAVGGFTGSGDDLFAGIARWTGQQWVPVGGSPDFQVNAAAVFNNRLVIGGEFTAIGEQPIPALAQWDGSRWSALPNATFTNNRGFRPVITALTVFNNELFVSGFFDSVAGTAARNIAIFNGSTWRQAGQGVEDPVESFTIFRNQLHAGGPSTGVGSTVIKWTGTTFLPVGGIEAGSPRALTPFRDELFAGPVFNFESGFMGRWDGVSWKSVGPGATGSIITSTTFEGDLVVGGSFIRIGNTVANGIARLHQSPAGPVWQPIASGFNDSVSEVEVYKGDLIAAGNFTATADGRTMRSISRWDGEAWNPMDDGMSGPVFTLAVHNGLLYAGGFFRFAGELIADNIAVWNGSSWGPVGLGTPEPDSAIFSIESVNNDLIVGGAFNVIDNVFSPGVAAFNGTQWRSLGNGVGGVFPFVYNSLAFDNKLIIAGTFDWAGSEPLPDQPFDTLGIAAWDGTRWSSVGGGFVSAITNGFVFDLHIHRNELYAAGSFDRVPLNGQGDEAQGVARFDGTTWRSTGRELRASFNDTGAAFALTSLNDRLVVAGQFTNVGGFTNTDQGGAAGHLAFWGCPCLADFNNNGLVDFFDYLDFLNAFANDSPTADFNNTRTVDFFDYLDYLETYNRGC
jgi:trimeric autotransporter adhesin